MFSVYIVCKILKFMHAAQCAGRNVQFGRSVGVKKLEWKHQAFYLDLKKS